MKKSLHRIVRFARFPAYAAIALLCYLVGLWATGNFHEVLPGELYRSAQLDEGELNQYAKDYGIRSVLNLRGARPGAQWYQIESAEAKANGITLIDYSMRSSKKLTKEQAEELIAIMRNAPKPLLIHCQAGANRTALAAAIYLAGVKDSTEFTADLQLTPIYGHLPLWFSPAYAMDESFEALDPLFGFDS